MISKFCRHGFLVLFVISLTAQAQASQRIFLILNIAGHGNADLDEGYTIRELRPQFPDTTFLTLRARDNDEVRDGLRRLVGPRDQIDGMYVITHGNSFTDRKVLTAQSSEAQINSYYDAVIASFDGSFALKVNDEGSMRDVFKAVIGKFAPNAKIIFTACLLVASGDARQKYAVMKQTARILGLKSGYIYMNSSFGYPFIKTYATQPFYEQKTVLTRVRSLGAQILAPVIYPIGIGMEKTVMNRGYSLEVRNGRHYTLYRDSMDNATRTILPLGQKANKPLVTRI